jgi:amino-acid N-acetyltransferase
MNSPGTCFIVAKQEGKIIGCIGLENCGKTGLLHSLAVKRDFRGSGLGRQLYEKASEQALDEGIEEFYVLTRASEGLFAKWGFQTIDREQAPAEISDTNDFKNAIFVTYTCMKKKLERKPAAAAPAKDVQAAAAPVVQETAALPAEQPVEEKAAVKDEPPVKAAPDAVEEPVTFVVEEPAAAPSAAVVHPAEGMPEYIIDPDAAPAAAGSASAQKSTQDTAAPVDEPPAVAASVALEAEKTVIIEPPVMSGAPMTMQETLQELNNLPDAPSITAEPAAAEAAAPLMVPSSDVALSVPADASLMKTASDDTTTAVPAAANTPDTPAPAAVTAADVKHFPADRLPLVSDLPGARAWGVSLSQTMLKYYEMTPETRLEVHTHGSEHVTMVVDGQLFFGVGDKVISVRGGEMLAMPANVPHSVFTNELPAKAFEAVAIIPEEGGR